MIRWKGKTHLITLLVRCKPLLKLSMQILHLLHGTLLGRNPGDLMLQHLGIGSRLEARDDDEVVLITSDLANW